MRKMLQMITLSEYGGASRVLTSLINNLPLDEFEITLLTGEGKELLAWLDEDIRKDIRHNEFKSLIRSLNPVKDLIALYQLYRFIKKEKFEIVHCHSSKAGVLGRIAARLTGVPKIYFTVHGWVMDDSQPWLVRTIYVMAERIAAMCSTKVICVSEADKRKALYYTVASEEKFIVVHNGIEEKSFQEGKLFDELSFGRDKFVAVMVARLAPPKLPLLFLECAKALRKNEDIVFVLIGGGKEYCACNNFVKENNLLNTFLLGDRSDVQELLIDADAAALLSEHEGLPMAVLEGMFAEKPVIASNVGGIPELIDNGKTGYLVSNDVDDIVSKILELYNNREKCKEMGQKALKKAKQNFSIKEMAKKYLEVYKSV